MSAKHPIIHRQRFDAVIFDMDGVVTRTAHVHAAAWKKMFDSFFVDFGRRTGESYHPFSIEEDYTRYVDGKPRYDGVRDFLESRGIRLPEGNPEDSSEQETVCGLGNRKNDYFQQQLEEEGAESYDTTVELIHALHRAGIRTAIISASKNARAVLASAGVDDLFDVRVDGLDAVELGIPGKPAPDVFLAAAGKLGVTPGRAVVVEDAQSGVQAGRAGGFGLVIGVDRANQRVELEKYADVVVSDLAEVGVEENDGDAKTTATLPSALKHFDTIIRRLADRQPAVFLDYDGTLTPIVERPEMAVISEEMRQTVEDLSRCCTVSIVSGRDRPDVEKLAAVQNIVYAGSHGFDIAGPAGKKMEFQQGVRYLPALEQAEKKLRERLSSIETSQVERKKFAIAVHFRRVPEERWPDVEKLVDEVLHQSEGLRKTGGKMIFELRPDIDWDKGKALSWLFEELGLDRSDVMPVYIGDDLTDEDALREIEDRGIGILVRGEDRPTAAAFSLENTDEVQMFMRKLADFLEREK